MSTPNPAQFIFNLYSKQIIKSVYLGGTESELQTAIKLQEEMHNKISAQQEERDVNM